MPNWNIIPESQLNQSFAVAPASDPTVSGYTPGNVDYSLFNPSQADEGTKLTETANAISWARDPTIPAYDKGGIAAEGFRGLTNGNFSQSMTDGLNQIGQDWGSNFDNAPDYATSTGSSFSAQLISKITGDLSKGIGGNGVMRWAVQLVGQRTREKFFCETMPRIQENGTVEYADISPVHHPGTIAKYITTPSRSWAISEIKLVSLTASDATANQNRLNLLRSWRMPYYGYGTEKQEGTPFSKNLGAPPEVLLFTAYGDKNIGQIPVVITDMSWSWPNDVDFVHTDDGVPFPVLMSVDISLKEAWSPRELSGFDLIAFRNGDMAAAYNPKNVPTLAYATPDQKASATGEAKKSEVTPQATPPTETKASALANTPASKTSGEVKVVSNKAKAEIDSSSNQIDFSKALLKKNGDPAVLNNALHNPVFDSAPKRDMMGRTAEERYKLNQAFGVR